jgi:phosphatidylserine/phosphatidylglycerophosphate/cardiolipin synthase-like enzyme
MKVFINLTGHYQRMAFSKQPPSSLDTWLQSTQETAKKLKQGSTAQLRQDFGLNYLSTQTLQQLLASENTNNTLSTPTFEISQFPKYQFITEGSESFELNLFSDDPQIPSYWEPNQTSQPGTYLWQKTENDIPSFLEALIHIAHQYWQYLPHLESLTLALQASDTNAINITVPHNLPLYIMVSLMEMSSEVQVAFNQIQTFTPSTEKRTTITASLIEEILPKPNSLAQNYLAQYFHDVTQELPRNLSLTKQSISTHQWIIGRGESRTAIEKVISSAQEFLLISSFIIESESIVQQICQKAAIIPVWILTNLNDETLNKLDSRTNIQDDYEHSTERKSRCLQLLLTAGATIREGSFHLKTYISERFAYLGSCNLTGGSLDYNLEAGIRCQNTPTHANLIAAFTHYWHHTTRSRILPSLISGSILIQSLPENNAPLSLENTTLLDPHHFEQDLIRELEFTTAPIIIYSRSFHASNPLLHQLKRRLTHLYLVSLPAHLPSDLNYTLDLIPYQHAKIILIGENIAYVGGTNFQFYPPPHSHPSTYLHDLMYKTKDSQEIKRLLHNLAMLKF